METSGDFIAMARPDGAVMYVNPAGRRLVGIEDRDVTAMTIADFLTEEGLTASIEVEQPAVVAQGRWSGQSTLRDHRGGPPIPVAIASFLMREPETGEPFALATVQRDISDRVAAQNELQRLADERQHLLDRLVQAQEDERARIAADVHDDSVQALAAVELRLGLLRRQLGRLTGGAAGDRGHVVGHRPGGDRPAPQPAVRPRVAGCRGATSPPPSESRPRTRSRTGWRGASPATPASTCLRGSG